MSEHVFVWVKTIEITTLAQQLLQVGYLACAIGSECVEKRQNKWLCVWDQVREYNHSICTIMKWGQKPSAVFASHLIVLMF